MTWLIEGTVLGFLGNGYIDSHGLSGKPEAISKRGPLTEALHPKPLHPKP